MLTSFFQEDATFRNDDGDVAINVGLAILVDEGDGNVGVGNALPERDSEYALGVH